MKKTFLIFATFCTLVLSACSGSEPESPEQQVRAVLAAIEEASEQRSLSGMMQHISNDYIDHRGNTNKDVKRLLQIHLLRNQNISVFTRISSLEVNTDSQPQTASVELSAAMAARGVDLSLETNRLKANTHRFSLALTLEGDAWRISSGSWQRGW